jgi:hypothetical protein
LKYLQSLLFTEKSKDEDLIEEFEKYLKKNLSSYVQETNDEIKEKLILKQEELITEKGKISKPIEIICPDIADLKLKSVSADESGILQTNFTLHSLYVHKNEDGKTGQIIIKIECPDTQPSEDCEVKCKTEKYGDEFRFIVRGKKKKLHLGTEQKPLHDLRKEGDFEFSTITLNKKDFGETEKLPNHEKNHDGCILIRYTYKKSDEDGWE